MSGDIHALSGAYAVDAVDDLERAMFERHLAQCGTCRAEVDSLREAGALIAETAAVAPPAALRARVLAGVESIRPLPPVIAAGAHQARSTRRRFPALVAAAAALIAFGAVGASVVHPWSSDDPISEVSAGPVPDAPDAETFTSPLAAGGKVTIVRSKALNKAVLSVDGLAALPEGQTYELWLIHDNKMIPAGRTNGDVTSFLFEGDARNASGAGITIEPTGGSTVPSADVVAIVPFEQA